MIQQLGNGMVLGAVYALFAIGYTLVFGVLDVLNLAHAAIFTLAAFVALGLAAAGMPLFGAALAAVGVAGLAGVLLDRVAFAPLRARRAGTLAPLISSIGAAIVLQALVRGVWGPDEHRFTSVPFADARMHAGALSFGALDLLVVCIALALVAAVMYVMRSTALGRNIRAVADDALAATLLGVDVEQTIALTFFVASALGGAAGILIGLQYNSVSLDMGARIELKGLAIIILGGMGSVGGAVAGAFLLGVIETLSVAYVSSSYRDAIAFGAMFLILIVRPTGLFGARTLRAA